MHDARVFACQRDRVRRGVPAYLEPMLPAYIHTRLSEASVDQSIEGPSPVTGRASLKPRTERVDVGIKQCTPLSLGTLINLSFRAKKEEHGFYGLVLNLKRTYVVPESRRQTPVAPNENIKLPFVFFTSRCAAFSRDRRIGKHLTNTGPTN